MSLKLQLRRLRLVLSELEKLFFRLLKRLRTLTTKLKVRLSFALSASFRFTLKKTCLLFFESKFLKKCSFYERVGNSELQSVTPKNLNISVYLVMGNG